MKNLTLFANVRSALPVFENRDKKEGTILKFVGIHRLLLELNMQVERRNNLYLHSKEQNTWISINIISFRVSKWFSFQFLVEIGFSLGLLTLSS